MQADNELIKIHSSGNDQDQQLQEDSFLITQIMENDIWMEVGIRMPKLKRCDDLKNLSDSSPFFWNLFRLHRQTSPTLFLFKRVFEIVVENIWRRNGQADFPLGEILNCRQVCKQWNQVVDTLLISHWYCRFDRFIYTRIENMDTSKYRNVFDLLSHFKSSHPFQSKRNPIIFPKLTVKIYCDDREDEQRKYFEGIGSVICKYGVHVKEFCVFFGENQYFDNFYKGLTKCLVRMPNIREFEISCVLSNDANDFQNLLVVAPFPNLKHLKILKVFGFPNVLLSSWVNINNQISLLSLGYENEMINFSLFPPLLNLSTLELNCPRNVASLNCFQLQCPNLHTLFLFRTSESESIKWSEVFEAIQDNFSSSLKHLNILEKNKQNTEKRGQNWKDTLNCRLNMPKLQSIILHLENPISLDFLLPMKDTLKRVTVNGEIHPVAYAPFSASKPIIPLQVVYAKCTSHKSLELLLETYNIRYSFMAP